MRHHLRKLRICFCLLSFLIWPMRSHQNQSHLACMRYPLLSDLVYLSVIKCNWVFRQGKGLHCSRLSPLVAASFQQLLLSLTAHCNTHTFLLRHLSRFRPYQYAQIVLQPFLATLLIFCSSLVWSSFLQRCLSTPLWFQQSLCELLSANSQAFISKVFHPCVLT